MINLILILSLAKQMDNPNGKKRRQNVASECNVGIIKHRNEGNLRIDGDLKENAFDFIVYEIDLNKQVVEMRKDMKLPILEKAEIVDESSWFDKLREHDILTQYYSKEELVKLENELQTLLENKDGEIPLILIKDKDHRKSIHALFKSCKKLFTKSKDNLIVVLYGKENSGFGRPMVNWKALGGQYLEFCLLKCNIDTIQAVNEIARRSHLQPKLFSYAGTKDKRACTSQLIRCHRVEYKRLCNVPFDFPGDGIKKIKLCNFKHVDSPLRLGDCFGNRFIVVLRNVALSSGNFSESELSEAVNDSLTELKNNGFINYFGMQRFGNSSVGTHDLGKLVILKEWYKLVQLLLEPRVGEIERIAEARQVYKDTNDCKLALNLFPYSCLAEKSVLGHLVKNPLDYKGAFNAIPRNLRTMYAHAYQSYIWNLMTTKRIEIHGYAVQTGDMVMLNDRELERNERGVKEMKPIIVNEENIKEYSIYDVVLPCPGSDTIFPPNLKSEYMELFKSEELTAEDFGEDPQLNLSGTYRHIISKAIDLKWDIFKYDDAKPLHAVFEEEMDNSSNGDKYAVKVQVSLKTSSYVTVMLRELLNTVE